MVLSEEVHCRSLSSIHILYNQPLVDGLSVHPDPATQIVNLQLHGGSSRFLPGPLLDPRDGYSVDFAGDFMKSTEQG